MQTQAVAEPSSSGALLAVLVAPRKTIRRVVDKDPTRHVFLLAAIAGIDQALSNASSQSFGDDNPLGVVIVGCLVLGSVGGLVSLYFLGALFRWSGRRLGGQASAEEVRAAIAWSNVPIVLAMSLWIPELLIFREELFTTAIPRMGANPWLAFALLGFLTIRMVAAIWAAVLFVKGLAEVHRFSAWRALGATLLPSLIILVAFVCLLSISVL